MTRFGYSVDLICSENDLSKLKLRMQAYELTQLLKDKFLRSENLSCYCRALQIDNIARARGQPAMAGPAAGDGRYGMATW